MVLMIAVLGSGCSESDPEEEGISAEEMTNLFRSAEPTPQLTAALLAAPGMLRVRAQRSALEEAHDSEMLNVLEHTVRLGKLDSTHWELLRMPLRESACVLGEVLSRDSPPSRGDLLHLVECRVRLSVERILYGTRLVPVGRDEISVRYLANTPSDFGVVEPGQSVVLVVAREARGLVCYDCAWPPTGREQDVFGAIAPLASVAPGVLARGLSSDDSVCRWLSAVQVLMCCRRLTNSPAMEFGVRLDKDWILPRCDAIRQFFAPLQGALKWSRTSDEFRRGQ